MERLIKKNFFKALTHNLNTFELEDFLGGECGDTTIRIEQLHLSEYRVTLKKKEQIITTTTFQI